MKVTEIFENVDMPLLLIVVENETGHHPTTFVIRRRDYKGKMYNAITKDAVMNMFKCEEGEAKQYLDEMGPGSKTCATFSSMKDTSFDITITNVIGLPEYMEDIFFEDEETEDDK